LPQRVNTTNFHHLRAPTFHSTIPVLGNLIGRDPPPPPHTQTAPGHHHGASLVGATRHPSLRGTFSPSPAPSPSLTTTQQDRIIAVVGCQLPPPRAAHPLTPHAPTDPQAARLPPRRRAHPPHDPREALRPQPPRAARAGRGHRRTRVGRPPPDVSAALLARAEESVSGKTDRPAGEQAAEVTGGRRLSTT